MQLRATFTPKKHLFGDLMTATHAPTTPTAAAMATLLQAQQSAFRSAGAVSAATRIARL